MFIIVGFFILAVVWAAVAEVDQMSSGEGRVVPSRQVQVVQNLEGGIVSELHVREGDFVESGQVLMQLDATQFSSDFMENQTKFLGLQAVVTRLRAEIDDTPLTFPEEIEKRLPKVAGTERDLHLSRSRELAAALAKLDSQHQQRLHEIEEAKARIAQLQTAIRLARDELAILEPLVARGINAPVELIRLKREESQNLGDLEVAKNSLLRLSASIDEIKEGIKEARAQFRSRALKELNEAQVNMEALGQTLTSRDDRLRRTVIRAPVTGVVKQLFVNTIGGVVRPGMDLLEIVPAEENLIVEAKIKPSDIAFLRPGLDAVVRFTAYDYTIFGSLAATLDQISADTILDEERKDRFYVIRLKAKTNSLLDKGGKPLPIIPGMTVSVDVKTGKRTILQYLMKPFRKLSGEAFHER
jgi:adhesin transport system membrane fusion protein